MALSNITISASTATAKTAAKTIAAESGTANAVIYTVPAGREAEVYIMSTYNPNYGSLNNVPIQQPYASTYFEPIGPIKLAAGTIFKGFSSGTQGIYGIEYDAQL